MKPSGYVFYRGPSLLDGAPIIGIVTTKSENRKTGPILQTWILRADLDPQAAARRDPALRQARKEWYRALLDCHTEAAGLYRAVVTGRLS